MIVIGGATATGKSELGVKIAKEINGEIVSAANGIAYRIDDMVSRQKLSGESLQRELRRLHETSAINAYHTERMHKELEYMNRMNYLSGRYDGTFFNQPPH